MKKTTAKSPALEWMLGVFGLTLILLIGWASDQTSKEPHTLATRARRIVGWLVMESVTGVGWAFDRMARVDVSPETRGFADSHRNLQGERQR